jgi:hypothetical protein
MDGRRTTHWCRCTISDKRFPEPVKKDKIQQAIRHGREICSFCERQPRESKWIHIDQSIGGCIVRGRVEDGQYPAGQSYDQWLVECPDGNPFEITGDELRRAVKSERLSLFCCGPACANSTWPKPPEYWEVIGPADARPGKEGSEQRWWSVRCIAPSKDGRQCGNIRVKSTSDLNKKNASKHCGCLTPSILQAQHAKSRRSDLDIGIYKLLKDYINPRDPSHFQIPFDDAKRLFLAPCTYCDREPFQRTEVEIYSSHCKRKPLQALIHGGIDRIDPKSVYLVSNSVPCCKTCNWFKSRESLQEFADRIRRVFERRNHILDIAQRIPDLPFQTHWLDSNRDTFCPVTYQFIIKHLYRSKESASKKQMLDFSLPFKRFELLSHNPCEYCTRPPSSTFRAHIKWGPKRGCTGNCSEAFYYHGLDRVKNENGYFVENSVPCCGSCNRAKKDLTIQEFVTHTDLLNNQLGNWTKRIESWTKLQFTLV